MLNDDSPEAIYLEALIDAGASVAEGRPQCCDRGGEREAGTVRGREFHQSVFRQVPPCRLRQSRSTGFNP